MRQLRAWLCKWFGHKFFTSALLDVVAFSVWDPHRYCSRCGYNEPVS